MADEIEMVSVPKELLREVLGTARSNNYLAEGEFACTGDDYQSFSDERQKIDRLEEYLDVSPLTNTMYVDELVRP